MLTVQWWEPSINELTGVSGGLSVAVDVQAVGKTLCMLPRGLACISCVSRNGLYAKF
jgi:hypothetical protein